MSNTEEITSAGGKHAMSLTIGRVFVREKHYAKLAYDSIEGTVCERKGSRVRRSEVYLFAWPELRARHLKHCRVEISRCHMSARRQNVAEVPRHDPAAYASLHHARST